MKKYLSFLFASILPICLFSWFVPDPKNQLDFLFLWWLAMGLLALPILYIEVALAHRSKILPLKGIAKLTREADSSTTWRLFSWINVFIILLIASSFVAIASTSLHPSFVSLNFSIPSYALALVLMTVVVIVSVWGFKIGLLGIVFASLAIGLQCMTDMSLSLQLTAISLLEWSQAVILALVSVGTGSGLYWFAYANAHQDDTEVQADFQASKVVLPIWITQLVVGTLTFLFLAAQSKDISISVFESLALLSFAAFLLKCVIKLLNQFLGDNWLANAKSLGIIFLFACVFVLTPSILQYRLLVLLTIISVSMFSIFAGWHMKVSHLRKSINFEREMTYNFFRVAIRLVVPISLLVALIGWIINWI